MTSNFQLVKVIDKWSNHWLIIVLILMSCKGGELTYTTVENGQMAELNSLNLQSPWNEFKSSTTRDFDLKHVDLDLELDLSVPAIVGIANLSLTPYFFDQDVVALDAKDLIIDAIRIFDTLWYQYEYNGRTLIIDLPRTFSLGEDLSIEIEYRVTNFALPAHASSRDEGGIFMIDYWPDRPFQIWTQGETEFTSTWYPTIDHPNERYTQELSITLPDSLQTFSNGVLLSQKKVDGDHRTDLWQLDKPHAPYLSALVIGQFDTYPLKSNSVKGGIWIEKGSNPAIAKTFERTGEMISLFEERFGVPYTWPVYNQIVVRDFISGAMENTGAVVFMEDLLSDNADYEYRHFDDVISHELAHHWFGNLVTCESWANLPLNESLASYSEQIWNEYYYGQDSADLIAFFELNDYLEEAATKKADLIRYYYDNPDADLFDRHSYSKGSRIMHMLRLYVGDDAFFASLKYYLSQHQFSNVEVHDLRLAFEKVTGMDLNWFFTQWFLNPGHPELEVVHRSEDDTLYIEVDQVQDLSLYPLYQLPVYVDINWGSEQLSYPLMIQNQRHVFKIPALGRKPQSIIFDSDYQLVGTVSHQKNVTELIHQIQNSDQIIGRYEAYLKLINEEQDEVAISKAIDLALQERHPMLLSLLLDQISLLNEDLVIAHRDKIIDLISHSSLHVRGSALYLASYFFADKINWTEFLGESNNYIKGIALENLCLNSDDQTKRNLLDEFKDSSSPDITLPLSYVINDIFKKGYSNWYQSKIMETLASDQLYILSAYNEYLLNAPQIELLQSREFIMRYAKFHENRDTRFVAFEGLVILSEKLDMSRFIEEVIAFEQDEQLLDIYQKILPR